MNATAELVREALKAVYDPCSVAMAAPISVADMGIVTRLDVDPQGHVEIELRPTSPMCTLIGSIMQAVEEETLKVIGVTTVVVTIETSKLWSEAEMSPEGRRRLEERRGRSRLEVPVERQEWKHRPARTPA
jgi:metal-sulfur cluster biosynthetic enzyme